MAAWGTNERTELPDTGSGAQGNEEVSKTWKQRGESHRGDFLEPTVRTGLHPHARDALEREATSPVLLWTRGEKYQKNKCLLGSQEEWIGPENRSL